MMKNNCEARSFEDGVFTSSCCHCHARCLGSELYRLQLCMGKLDAVRNCRYRFCASGRCAIVAMENKAAAPGGGRSSHWPCSSGSKIFLLLNSVAGFHGCAVGRLANEERFFGFTSCQSRQTVKVRIGPIAMTGLLKKIRHCTASRCRSSSRVMD